MGKKGQSRFHSINLVKIRHQEKKRVNVRFRRGELVETQLEKKRFYNKTAFLHLPFKNRDRIILVNDDKGSDFRDRVRIILVNDDMGRS